MTTSSALESKTIVSLEVFTCVTVSAIQSMKDSLAARMNLRGVLAPSCSLFTSRGSNGNIGVGSEYLTRYSCKWLAKISSACDESNSSSVTRVSAIRSVALSSIVETNHSSQMSGSAHVTMRKFGARVNISRTVSPQRSVSTRCPLNPSS